MAYLNVINQQGDDNVLSGFGTVIINTDAIGADKELLVPYGYDLDSGIALKVVFTNGHNCVDASTPLTVKIKYADGSYIMESGSPKEIAVKVNQYGTLVNLPIHNISSTYKCLDPNTVLEMYYNGTDFVVIGNPTVLASDNYEIKANGKNTALEAHPIHSLYWSSDSTSPNILFGGGTWVQIKDRFLLAAGDTYSNGSTGGSATHTLSGTTDGHALTVEEMPAHTHSMRYIPYTLGGSELSVNTIDTGNTGPTVNTSSNGSNQAHSHTFTTNSGDTMPPYLAVKVWKRTA